MSTIIETPLDESSDNSDDPTITQIKPSGIVSPPPFYTKRAKPIPKMTRFKLFPKRKSSFNQPTRNGNSSDNTSTLPFSTLPHYSTVNPNPNDYPLNTTSDNNDSERPVKVYSKTNYPFAPPSF